MGGGDWPEGWGCATQAGARGRLGAREDVNMFVPKLGHRSGEKRTIIYVFTCSVISTKRIFQTVCLYRSSVVLCYDKNTTKIKAVVS